jgi:uncharacterized protein YigE (DUF2233 family)
MTGVKSVQGLEGKGMKTKRINLTLAICVLVALTSFQAKHSTTADRFLAYTVNLLKADLQLYWKNDSGQVYRSIGNLKADLKNKHKELVFAMNGGMFKADHSAQGLFIQAHKILSPLDTSSGKGNFYLKPNGVFYLTDKHTAVVCSTPSFVCHSNISYATQSGPMLVIDGKIHPAFSKGSKNVNIRNGVGILPDGQVVFVLSKEQVNLYDFAAYFKSLGCKNALYLDGFVSRAYLPAQSWLQEDGSFGVMIGVTRDAAGTASPR